LNGKRRTRCTRGRPASSFDFHYEERTAEDPRDLRYNVMDKSARARACARVNSLEDGVVAAPLVGGAGAC
jgi:hypothetical protein